MVLTTVPTTALTVYAENENLIVTEEPAGISGETPAPVVTAPTETTATQDPVVTTPAPTATQDPVVMTPAPTATQDPAETTPAPTATQDPVVTTPDTTETLESQKAAAKATVEGYKAFLDEIDLEAMGVPADDISAVTEKLNAIKEEVNGALTAIENAENADEVEAAKQTATEAMAKLDTLSSDSEGTPDTLDEVAGENKTLTIGDFSSLSDKVEIRWSVDGGINFDTGAATTAEKQVTAAQIAAGVQVKVTAKPGYKIKHVYAKSTELTAEDGGSPIANMIYALNETAINEIADSYLNIETAQTYKFVVPVGTADDGSGTDGTVIKLDSSLKEITTLDSFDDGITVAASSGDAVEAVIEDGSDLKFTVTKTGLAATKKLVVKYQTDSNAVDNEFSDSDSASAYVKDGVYTIKKSVIDSLNEKITLKLSIEDQVKVKRTADATSVIKQVTKTDEGEDALGGIIDATGLDAWKGDSFRFTVTPAAGRKLKTLAVTKTSGGGEVEYEASTTTVTVDGESEEIPVYIITAVPEALTITATTELDDTKNYSVSWKLAEGCDPDSVKSVKITTAYDASMGNPVTTGDLRGALGMPAGATGAIEVPKDGSKLYISADRLKEGDANYKAAIVIEVEAAEGFVIDPGENTSGAVKKAKLYYYFSKNAAQGSSNDGDRVKVAYPTGENFVLADLTVKTEVAAGSAADTYFSINTNKASNPHVSVSVPEYADGGVQKIVKTDETSGTATYKVESGAKTLSFDIVVSAGYELPEAAQTAIKAVVKKTADGNKPVVGIEKSANSDGSTVYKVKMLAEKLNDDSTAPTAVLAATMNSGSFEALMMFATQINPAPNDGATLFETSAVTTVDKNWTNTTVDATLDSKNQFPTAKTDFDAAAATVDAEFGGAATGADFPYNSKVVYTIYPKTNQNKKLAKVTYKVGKDGAEQEATYETIHYGSDDEDVTDGATITIDKVTDNVFIKVEMTGAYTLNDLYSYTDDSNVGSALTKTNDSIEPNKNYNVTKGTKYVVAVKEGDDFVDEKDVKIRILANGEELAMNRYVMNKTENAGAVKPYFVIDLANKKFADQLNGSEVQVEMSVKDTVVGSYILNVSKKTTEIKLGGSGKAEQVEGTTAWYDIDTDGEMLVTGDLSKAEGAVPDGHTSTDLTGSVTAAVEEHDGKDMLKVVVAAVGESALRSKNAVAASNGVEAAPAEYKKNVTITATKDGESGTLNIVLLPAMTEKPTVSVETASDTTLNLQLGSALAEEPSDESSEYWYEIKAQAQVSSANPIGEGLNPSVTKYVKRTGSGQKFALPVSALQVGEAAQKEKYAATEYKVTVTLAQFATTVADRASLSGNIGTLVSEPATGTTQDVKFADSFKLKKGSVKKIYTGQEFKNVIVATPENFDKITNYKIITGEFEDNRYNGNLESILKMDANGNIVLNGILNTNTDLGNHVITVKAVADSTAGHEMYAARATFTLNVVRGIESLNIDLPSDQIYVASGKTAALSPKVIYNGNAPTRQPSQKTVNWRLVGSGTTTGINQTSIKSVPSNIASGVEINAKNGKITVKKNFAFDTKYKSNNTFKVLVEAKDYEGNKKNYVSSVITLTNEKPDLGNLVIAKMMTEGEHQGEWRVYSMDAKKTVEVEANVANGAKIVALAKGVSVPAGYVPNWKWNTYKKVPVNILSFKSSAVKSLRVNESGTLEVLDSGRTVTVTVTANDSSKQKNSIKVKLLHAVDTGDLALRVAKAEDTKAGTTYRDKDGVLRGADDYDETNLVYNPSKEQPSAAKHTKTVSKTCNVVGAARLKVTLMTDKAAAGKPSDWKAAGFANCKLSIKGGKLVAREGSDYYIVTNKAKTILTLTDKSKKPAVKYTYEINNTAFAEGMAKAPKITVNGVLHDNGKEDVQKVILTVKSADGSLYPENTYVKIEPDWSMVTDKNAWAVSDFNSKIDLDLTTTPAHEKTAKLSKDGEVTLSFAGETDVYGIDDVVRLTKGSYKLSVTVGSKTGVDGDKLNTLAGKAVVNVVERKTLKFTPAKTYTIGQLDGSAVISGKSNASVKNGESVEIVDAKLLNMNRKGIGKSNKFTHWFKAEMDPTTKTWRIVLNAADPEVKALTADGKGDLSTINYSALEQAIGKDNLTGYLHYVVKRNTNEYSYDYAEGDAKITIKFAKPGKAASKYTAAAGKISAAANQTADMNVLVNGQKINVAAVALVSDKTDAGITLAPNATGVKDSIRTATGSVVLKSGGLTSGKNVKVTLRVLPKDSFCLHGKKNLTDNEKATLLTQYGIEVSATVAVK